MLRGEHIISKACAGSLEVSKNQQTLAYGSGDLKTKTRYAGCI